MAGSIAHIIAEDGTLRMDLLDHMGDAHEALAECHQIIAVLLARFTVDNMAELAKICRDCGFPIPCTYPVVQAEFHGSKSVFREDREEG